MGRLLRIRGGRRSGDDASARINLTEPYPIPSGVLWLPPNSAGGTRPSAGRSMSLARCSTTLNTLIQSRLYTLSYLYDSGEMWNVAAGSRRRRSFNYIDVTAPRSQPAGQHLRRRRLQSRSMFSRGCSNRWGSSTILPRCATLVTGRAGNDLPFRRQHFGTAWVTSWLGTRCHRSVRRRRMDVFDVTGSPAFARRDADLKIPSHHFDEPRFRTALRQYLEEGSDRPLILGIRAERI